MYSNYTNNANKETEGLIHKELSFLITGVLFSAHNELGSFAREKQYCDSIERIFNEKQISYFREKVIGDSGNILDFLVENKVILEVKAKRVVTKEDYYQTQRYLQETGLKLALLVNMRDRFIKPKRIIRIENWKGSY